MQDFLATADETMEALDSSTRDFYIVDLASRSRSESPSASGHSMMTPPGSPLKPAATTTTPETARTMEFSVVSTSDGSSSSTGTTETRTPSSHKLLPPCPFPVSVSIVDPSNENAAEVSVSSDETTTVDTADAPQPCNPIQVAIRMRPIDRSTPRGWMVYTGVNGRQVLQQMSTVGASCKKYSFDHIFEGKTSTRTVYGRVAQPVVEAFSEGKHGTVLAFGQMSSGKTHTIQGDESEPGMIEYAATDLFDAVSRELRDCTVKVQFFEIGNEEVRDLLAEKDAENDLPTLSVRDDGEGNVVLDAVVEESVESVDDVLRILERGNHNRASVSSPKNAQSSQSHAIFRFCLESLEKDGNGETTSQRVSVLNLVDLAGAGGKGDQSLLSLYRVVHALSLPVDKRPKHIPYRDSKLTHILQKHLSGNACMAVVCCVSADMQCLEESKSSLKFAANAKRIDLRPVVNDLLEDERTAQLIKLQKELAETKSALYKLKEQVRANDACAASVSSSEAVLGESISSPRGRHRSDSDASPIAELLIKKRMAPTRLERAERQAKLLQDQLLASETMCLTLFKNLKRTQRHYDELERLNMNTVSCEDLDMMLLHSAFLRIGIAASLAALYFGSIEYFAAIVAFLFLTFEVATS